MIRKATGIVIDAVGMLLLFAVVVWGMTDGMARLIEWML